MEIRRANGQDIPGLNRLLYQVAKVHSDSRPDLFKAGGKKYTDQELLALLQDDARPVFAAVDESGRVLGYAFCILQSHPDDNILTPIRTLYIDDLCVDEDIRGQHIGRALYAYVKNYAKDIGCYNLTLNVWACNESARKFYERCGLVPQKYGMETIL